MFEIVSSLKWYNFEYDNILYLGIFFYFNHTVHTLELVIHIFIM